MRLPSLGRGPGEGSSTRMCPLERDVQCYPRALSAFLCLSVPLALAGLPARGQTPNAVDVYARGDYAGVVAMLEPKVRADSASIQQRLILSRAYLHLGRKGDATSALRLVLAAAPENPEANSLLGRLLHEKGREPRGAGPLEAGLPAEGRRADSGRPSAAATYALGKLALAKTYLEKAIAQDIRDGGHSLLLGRICLGRGMGALAEKYLLMSEEAGTASGELYLLLGRAYMIQRKYVSPVLVRRLSAQAEPGAVVDGLRRPGTRRRARPDRYKVCTRYCALYEGYRLRRAEPDSVEADFMLARSWLAAGRADLGAAPPQALDAEGAG